MSNDVDTVSKGTSLGGCTVQDKISEREGATQYSGQFTPEGTSDSEPCCVTVYAERCFPSALVRERSLRELRQLMTLERPTLLRVREVGKLEDGGIFEVNERTSGNALSQFKGTLAPEEAFAVLSAIGESLLAAQNAGVIHRNLGPDVIYYEGDKPGKDLKVGGFGVAEPQGNGSFGPLSTLAPEQVAGKVVDQRSMVYNLAALGHRLITGENLYQGSPEEQLRQHLEGLIPNQVNPRFVRALQKDPRRRPMMLKQFLDELVASSEPAASPVTESSAEPSTESAAEPQKPSTRGWTQFMDDDEVEGGSATGGSSAPKVPSSGSTAEVKPSTRGWTMFMDADDAEPEARKAPATSAESVKPGGPADKTPKTRGWTMFMDGPDDAGDDAQEAKGPQPPEKKATAPAAKSASAAAKPKTRGWTMFMDESPGSGESATPPASIPDPTSEQPAVAASLASPATPSTGAAVAGNAASAEKPAAPSTRGWTMFMDAPPGTDGSAKAPESTPGSTASPAAAALKIESKPVEAPLEARPSANGDGVHTPEPPAKRFPAPKSDQKSAVETSKRRVSSGMPKPQDELSESVSDTPSGASGNAASGIAKEAQAPTKRARTMVMGGSKAPEEGAEASSVSYPAAESSQALANPEAEAATSLIKNPIPESPAPAASDELSIYKVAAGAGLAGVVLAGVVLIVLYVLG